MNDMMEHKGYFGTVQYSDDDAIFYGKVAFVRALISYEGESVQVLKQSFCEAVDDYLATCEAEGKKPDVPFKGTFNVRTGPDLHREAAIFAARHRMNLNSVVKAALQRYLSA